VAGAIQLKSAAEPAVKVTEDPPCLSTLAVKTAFWLVGGVISIVYTSPTKGRAVLIEWSKPVALSKLIPTVPSVVGAMVIETVHKIPPPPMTGAPGFIVPVVCVVKFEAVTPATAAPKLTSQVKVIDPLLGLLAVLEIEFTVVEGRAVAYKETSVRNKIERMLM